MIKMIKMIKKMKKQYLQCLQFLMGIILSTLSAGLAHGKTLIISDIDDTLKVVHVLSAWDALKNGLRTDQSFSGMSKLFNDLAKIDPEYKIAYLSNAPSWFMESTHLNFLEENHYPKGEYIPRTDLSQEEHKLTHIRRLIEKEKPERVVLIGDNGENDAIFYHQIAQEYQNKPIRFWQFIRVLYDSNSPDDETGKKLSVEQIAFVSPVDIQLSLFMNQMYAPESIQKSLYELNQQIQYERRNTEEDDRLVFPGFVLCPDYQWKWDSFLEYFQELKLLKAEIRSFCHGS